MLVAGRDILSPWEQSKEVTDKSPEKLVYLGKIGVDSASLVFGDAADRDQLEVFTPTGDGCFPLFSALINGRKCLVVDFDLAEYKGKILRVHHDWRCTFCGEGEFTGHIDFDRQVQVFACRNGHSSIIQLTPFTNWVFYKEPNDHK